MTERRYNERECTASLDHFLSERKESLVWLRTLSAPDWAVTYEASFGPITAGDVMASWIRDPT